MTDGDKGDMDDAFCQAALVHQLARQHKERDRHQWKTIRAVDDVLRHDLGIEHADRAHQRDAADDQRERNRHAERHRAEQGEGEDRDRHVWSSVSLTATISASLAWPETTRNRSYSKRMPAETPNTTPAK